MDANVMGPRQGGTRSRRGMHLHVRASQQSQPLSSVTIAPALGTPFPRRRGIYSLELEQRAQQHRDCLRVQKRRAACATLLGKTDYQVSAGGEASGYDRKEGDNTVGSKAGPS